MILTGNQSVRWCRAWFSLLLIAALAGCQDSTDSAGMTRAADADGRVTAEADAADLRELARDAYIYANPLVDSYRVFHSYFIDEANPEFKAPWNQIANLARVYTHEDTAVQTANSDTPYSFLGLDLRTEPMVLTVPEMEQDRYFSIQLIDFYTHNFDYIGSRTTGNEGGQYLVAGPGWDGAVPAGIDGVYRSETELMLAIYRTQLFNPEDLDSVVAIQAGYVVEPLSAFLGEAPPPAAPAIDFIQPLNAEELRSSPAVFEQLNFILQFCPTHPSEEALMTRFGELGIGAGKPFDADALSPDKRAAIEAGIADAWVEFEALRKQAAAGEITSGEVFGTREFLQNNYRYRMAAAVLGIWGNTEQEAIYPVYFVDADGQALEGTNDYRLRFSAGELPPVNAFWSLTIYRLPESLLVDNPIDRYLINSTMLDQFVRDDDGGITIYLQHESPGKDFEANWLPVPEGPFSANLRLYWPKAEALDGTWTRPPLVRMDP